MNYLLRILKTVWEKSPKFLIVGAFRILPHSLIKHLGPVEVTIEPTTACNLNCKLCPRTKLTRSQGSMTFENFKKIIDDLPRMTRLIDLYFMGEPLLAPDIFKMIKHASNKNLKVRISSNAMLLKKYTNQLLDSGLSDIIVAVDGATSETYSKYRTGGKFEDVIENIRFFLSERRRRNLKKPEIIFQMVVFKHNEHEVKDLISLCKALKVDHLILKLASLIGGDKKEKLGHTYLPKDHKYLRKKYKSSKAGACWWAFTAAITQDGKMIPCCYDWDGSCAYGNIFEDGFKKTYESKQNTAIRKKIIGQNLNICRDCDYNMSSTIRIF